MMNISNSMNYMNNFYNNSLFTTQSRRSNGINNLFNGANYYNTISKYAIANQYKHPNTAATSKTTTSSTNFLSKYDTNYSNLDKATSTLKESLKGSKDSDVIAAAEAYVKAYNSTEDFLNDKTSPTTSRLNLLKNSLSVVTDAGRNDLAGIGINKNKDGSLSLDQKVLANALSKNTTTTKHTLNSLTARSTVTGQMAAHTSKASLVKEQTKELTKTALSNNDATYEDFLALAKNQTALKNYYYNVASLGMFMDFSL